MEKPKKIPRQKMVVRTQLPRGWGGGGAGPQPFVSQNPGLNPFNFAPNRPFQLSVCGYKI